MNREARRAAGLVTAMSERGPVLVEKDALRIVEKIRQYDENLRVQYVEDRDDINTPPFRLVEHCRDGQDRVVFHFWELDDRVMERLFRADTVKQDINGRLDSANAKARLTQKRRYQEKIDEAHEIAKSVLRSPKSTYVYKDEEGRTTKFK